MPATSEQQGLVLCDAGPQKFAVMARQLTTVDALEDSWEDVDTQLPYARWAFNLPGTQGRVIRSPGAAVVVDRLEVLPGPREILEVPALLRAVFGGAIVGFFAGESSLLPVFEMLAFHRFLLASRPT